MARLPSQLGVLLRSRRKELGLSQHETAAQGGLQQKTVSSLENDPQRCTIDSLYRLMAALKVELVLQPREAQVGSVGDDW
ncbi:helix-turn-helix domain-containing protein [Synechococcus sp. J7-Johnson]|uniref:helix-turn-helix domain-containing protein n=1 Tax=Synechococcus sp. J7-Johnson TaxID=2823737 RepID=UPI0020CEF9EB|nr:helix-turn-helix domain-containing protein [Synechococcus sp. J7-Johnson]MCP9842093.1 helix-turn-helix domain-containing protein [Synechococcus sp. J7-Johnson]